MIELYAKQNEAGKGHETWAALLEKVFSERYPGNSFPDLIRGANGKPEFAEKGLFRFNVSHSGCWTVLAVSDNDIGVDIQLIRPIGRPVTRRFFTPRENEYLASLSDDERIKESIRIWSIKEAVTKAEGSSLALRMSGIQTVAFDGTYKTAIDGKYVYFPEFKDRDYRLTAASASSDEIRVSYIE